jgi:16S rRNA G966 N2-methylase RsmD
VNGKISILNAQLAELEAALKKAQDNHAASEKVAADHANAMEALKKEHSDSIIKTEEEKKRLAVELEKLNNIITILHAEADTKKIEMEKIVSAIKAKNDGASAELGGLKEKIVDIKFGFETQLDQKEEEIRELKTRIEVEMAAAAAKEEAAKDAEKKAEAVRLAEEKKEAAKAAEAEKEKLENEAKVKIARADSIKKVLMTCAVAAAVVLIFVRLSDNGFSQELLNLRAEAKAEKKFAAEKAEIATEREKLAAVKVAPVSPMLPAVEPAKISVADKLPTDMAAPVLAPAPVISPDVIYQVETKRKFVPSLGGTKVVYFKNVSSKVVTITFPEKNMGKNFQVILNPGNYCDIKLPQGNMMSVMIDGGRREFCFDNSFNVVEANIL